MTQHFNYRHLHYFWVVAKEGSMTKAASRLNIAVQTVSTQVHELEKDLGHLLFKPAGRGLVLTDAGFAAMKLADQIFQIGEKLPSIVSGSAATPRNRLALGVADGLPKLVSKELLDGVIHEQQIQLICHEGEFEDLLADLALHRLDLVFADRPAPVNKNMSLYSQELGHSPITWLASEELLAEARKNFPYSLATIPVIMPTYHSTVRFKLDLWFEKLGITPNIVGEFEDEHDLAQLDTNILLDASGRYRVKAQTPVATFNEAFGCTLDEYDAHTIGGQIVHYLGRVPRRNESLEFNGLLIRIIRADNRRLYNLMVEVLNNDEDTSLQDDETKPPGEDH
jgi:LysR family transcriptional activator of nhaA